jgi:hypothetical protein
MPHPSQCGSCARIQPPGQIEQKLGKGYLSRGVAPERPGATRELSLFCQPSVMCLYKARINPISYPKVGVLRSLALMGWGFLVVSANKWDTDDRSKMAA